jgi:hypothetical protein
MANDSPVFPPTDELAIEEVNDDEVAFGPKNPGDDSSDHMDDNDSEVDDDDDDDDFAGSSWRRRMQDGAPNVIREEAEQRLARATECKQQGNEAVKTKDWPSALHHYDAALQALRFVAPTNSLKSSQLELETACCLNRALCLLHVPRYRDAAEMCTKVLKRSPNNVKVSL